MGMQGNYKNGFVYWIILMITFWILYSYLVPISLFVSLEIVKFWQGFLYINHDPEMKVCSLHNYNAIVCCLAAGRLVHHNHIVCHQTRSLPVLLATCASLLCRAAFQIRTKLERMPNACDDALTTIAFASLAS